MTTAESPPTRRSGPDTTLDRPNVAASQPNDTPTVPVPADVLQAAAQLVADVSERVEQARQVGYWHGWHLGLLTGREQGWTAGHAAGRDAGGARVLDALRAGWPDLRPAQRLVSRQYVDLLDGPGVAAPCTCSCCRRWRDGRAA